MQIINTSLLTLIILSTALAFVPQHYSAGIRLVHLASTSKNADVLGDATVDINHAKYCADHFGECSLEDMERLCNALHQERISHIAAHQTGLNNPHGLPSDLEHTILEKELTTQMGLLRDRLATEHMQDDSIYGANPYSATVRMPVLDGTLDEESSETLMICFAIAALALLPQLL
ncbi:hypothetical protein HJC23_008089 [Cyclotella cryptica]|uniref:Uncharacterized protein n=1 Tax=Cyclotella cryptica TaxID=29204 RepID=A0ABD3PF91_9STRA|eukprot:CCRYP_014990-RA/>CCRYP_014990-RA protein AED:0.01 eAED:0.01 QI:182/1/1/1/0.5/0.33/3/2243/174